VTLLLKDVGPLAKVSISSVLPAMKSKLLAAVLVLALPFAALRAEPQTFTVDTV